MRFREGQTGRFGVTVFALSERVMKKGRNRPATFYLYTSIKLRSALFVIIVLTVFFRFDGPLRLDCKPYQFRHFNGPMQLARFFQNRGRTNSPFILSRE